MAALSTFHASISGFDKFGAGDAIQVLGGGYAFLGATETATSTTLTFSNGATQTLTLLGDYRGGTFSSQTVTGGVAVTYAV